MCNLLSVDMHFTPLATHGHVKPRPCFRERASDARPWCYRASPFARSYPVGGEDVESALTPSGQERPIGRLCPPAIRAGLIVGSGATRADLDCSTPGAKEDERDSSPSASCGRGRSCSHKSWSRSDRGHIDEDVSGELVGAARDAPDLSKAQWPSPIR